MPPVYSLEPDALIQVQMVGRLHGQATRNVYHYRFQGAAAVPDAVPELLALGDSFNATIGTQWLNKASNEWTHIHTQVQVVKPSRRRAVFVSVNLPGVVQQNSLPSFCAFVVSTVGAFSGQKFQGRHYYPGVPVNAEIDSKITPAFLVGIGAFEAVHATPLSGQTVVQGFAPTTQTASEIGAISGIFDIVDAFARDIIRVQRRREVGVGE